MDKAEVANMLHEAGLGLTDVNLITEGLPDQAAPIDFSRLLLDRFEARKRWDPPRSVVNWATGLAKEVEEAEQRALEAAAQDMAPDDGPVTTPENTPAPLQALMGTNTLPSVIAIPGTDGAFLGDVVRRAWTASGLSVDDWNGLPDSKRDLMINATVDAMRQEATPTEPPVDDPGKPLEEEE